VKPSSILMQDELAAVSVEALRFKAILQILERHACRRLAEGDLPCSPAHAAQSRNGFEQFHLPESEMQPSL